MTEKYTGKDRRYTGDEVDITYSLKRCIHAERCIHHLSSVFDNQKRPWINARGAPVEAIVSVIEMCPSGALHYDRRDGITEKPPEKNVVMVKHNGPLEIRGDLAIYGATVELEHETRTTLCRCGASNNKPFCDNAHENLPFEAVEVDPVQQPAEQPAASTLTILVEPNGPLELQGALEIVNEAGDTLFTGSHTWLCRCGGSNTKPFCDSTHKRNAFTAE